MGDHKNNPVAQAAKEGRFTLIGDGAMPDAERAELRRIVNRAHARSQAVRFWGTPDPAAFWQELRAEGVDLIGCDDLDAFAEALRLGRGDRRHRRQQRHADQSF